MTKIHCEYTELKEPSSLVGHPQNPNQHGDEQIRLLSQIIKHQGWRNPIVVSTRSNFIVAGHARLKAAELLKVKEVPVDFQDFESEADEYAHLVADNRIAELAEVDNVAIVELIKELEGAGLSTELAGFTTEDMDELIVGADFEPGTIEEQGSLDSLFPKMISCPHCSKEFNIREHE